MATVSMVNVAMVTSCCSFISFYLNPSFYLSKNQSIHYPESSLYLPIGHLAKKHLNMWLRRILLVVSSGNLLHSEVENHHAIHGKIHYLIGKSPFLMGKSAFFMGKSTISMTIFHSFLYVYQAGYPPGSNGSNPGQQIPCLTGPDPSSMVV